ncbi:MAG: hypothetical protein FWB85_11440 [Chitinispirillia bacterium]|nr:hypothetical protein [Chitinispirillia bacterium]
MKRVSSETLYFYDSWVIPIIRDKYGLDDEQAMRKFISSETYKMLTDEEMKLFRESPLVIFDMYRCDVETGNPRNSSYIQRDAYAMC